MSHWKRATFLVVSVVLFAGCAGPRYTGDGISEPVQSSRPEVVVIEDEATKEGFKEAIVNWLEDNQYSYTLKPDGSDFEAGKLNIEYVGHWNWDLAIYLSRAEIEAYYEGQRVGNVLYRAPNTLNGSKFSNAESRIQYMMDVLFDKMSSQEATDAL